MGEAMVKRQNDKHHRILRNRNHRMGLLHIGSIVPVSQEDTLRVSRGAGGIADIGIIIRSDGLVSPLERSRILLHELVAEFQHLGHRDLILLIFRKVVQDNDFLHSRNLSHNTSYLRKLRS